MRQLVIGVVLAGCLVPSGFAAHKPGKRDEGQGVGQTVERAAKEVAKEAVDAVADELLDDKGRVTQTGTGSLPPGLAKKGKMPPGLLEKQGKTPPGWSQGKKTGWDKDQPQKESLVRRVIRKIFRRSQEPAQPQPVSQ